MLKMFDPGVQGGESTGIWKSVADEIVFIHIACAVMAPLRASFARWVYGVGTLLPMS